MAEILKIETRVNKPVREVWKLWINPDDITNWYFANDDWECSTAENDLTVGGKFSYRLNAKDNSMGFDFSGEYIEIRENEYISYKLDDGRKSEIKFISEGDETIIDQEFEAEIHNDLEMQKLGWQSILNNFKKYAEGR